jgi:hypothetical protein
MGEEKPSGGKKEGCGILGGCAKRQGRRREGKSEIIPSSHTIDISALSSSYPQLAQLRLSDVCGNINARRNSEKGKECHHLLKQPC